MVIYSNDQWQSYAIRLQIYWVANWHTLLDEYIDTTKPDGICD